MLKININKKNKKLVLKKNKKLLKLIEFLIKVNIVKYVIKNTKYYFININILKNNKTLMNVKNLYNTSNIKYLNNKKLFKIKTLKNFIILSTNKGYKTNYECKKLKIGGVLIVSLWN